jgi:chromosome partitioning protein
LLDLPQIGQASIAHITARQELREMIAGLGLPEAAPSMAPLQAAE